MTNNQEKTIKYLNRPITRRQAVKAGGIAVVGLAFSKPLIETLYPKPAFAQYIAFGNPSIRWRCPTGFVTNSFTVICPPSTGNLEDPDPGDDLGFVGAASSGAFVTVFAYLCDNSTPATQDSYFSKLLFEGQMPGRENINFISVSVNGNAVSPGKETVVGQLGPPDCRVVRFDISLNTPNTAEVKLRFRARPIDSPTKMVDLVISLL